MGYSATNNGSAQSPDADIKWVTRVNITNNGRGIVYGNLNGPSTSEGGASSLTWSYRRLTLTNFNNISPRIAQVFTINFGSTGRHHTFLGLGGGTLYGNLKVNGDIYERGTKLVEKYLGKGAKAADSDQLNGQNSSYYLDYDNLKNRPSIPAAYVLPIATNTVLGGVKSATTGTTVNRDYNVQVKSDGTMKVNVPWTDTNTDTKVTSEANHYTPKADSSAQLSVDASGGAAAAWNSTSLVTGVNIQRDSKGHVTGVTVDSIKRPANPNTDTNTHYTARLYVGAQNTQASGATSNDGTYLKLFEDSTRRDQYKITGSGATTVTSDASGNITINTKIPYQFTYQNGYLVVQEL